MKDIVAAGAQVSPLALGGEVALDLVPVLRVDAGGAGLLVEVSFIEPVLGSAGAAGASAAETVAPSRWR